MNVSDKVFPYFWHWDETETDNTVFRVYTLDKTNKTVCLIINDFTPYCYLELPHDLENN